jgi:hypothetical protein
MLVIIYIVAAFLILMGIGGLTSNRFGVVLGSCVYISFAILAISLKEWWPLVNALAVNWGLRLLGFDPGHKK